MKNLSASKQRLLAIVLLILFVFVISIFILQPLWLQYADNQAQIEQTQEFIGRFENLESVAKENEQRLDELRRVGDISQYLLPTETTGLATARLQKLVKSVVARSGGQLISTRNLPEEAVDLLQQVKVAIKIRANITAIQHVLHALESHVPLLKLDNVSMNWQDRTRAKGGRQEGQVADSIIDFRFHVSGYLQLAGDSK